MQPSQTAVESNPAPFQRTLQVLLTTSQAAERIGFSDSFLEHDRTRPKPRIPFVKIGRAVRYRLSDLLAFMDEPAKAA